MAGLPKKLMRTIQPRWMDMLTFKSWLTVTIRWLFMVQVVSTALRKATDLVSNSSDLITKRLWMVASAIAPLSIRRLSSTSNSSLSLTSQRSHKEKLRLIQGHIPLFKMFWRSFLSRKWRLKSSDRDLSANRMSSMWLTPSESWILRRAERWLESSLRMLFVMRFGRTLKRMS